MRLPLAAVAMVLFSTPTLGAQQPPPDLFARLAGIEAAVVRVAGEHPNAIWPGFRPDTIPVLYLVPEEGILLLNWRSARLPDGFSAVPGAADAGWQPAAVRTGASTGTSLAGRQAAQVFVFPDASDALLFGTAVHEAFHVFERSVERDGRKFGSGENAFLISTYPVFDPANEAGWALEGRLLARALAARSTSELRERAREFVAAREARQRRLGTDFSDFEQLAELNEGLAEYTLVRSLQLAAADPTLPWRAGAEAEVRHHWARLDRLTADVRQSLRLRFYATGPAMGALLDRLAGPAWRNDLVRHDLTVQDELAEVSGYREPEHALLRRADAAVDTAALGREALAAVARLRAIRRLQVDSALARPGLTVVLRADSLPGRHFGLCGIDPQNLLQVDTTVLLHTRWVRPCGPGFSADVDAVTVQDKAAGTFTAVVGPADSVRVVAAGTPLTLGAGETTVREMVKVAAPGLSLAADRAMITRRGTELEIVPITGR